MRVLVLVLVLVMVLVLVRVLVLLLLLPLQRDNRTAVKRNRESASVEVECLEDGLVTTNGGASKQMPTGHQSQPAKEHEAQLAATQQAARID